MTENQNISPAVHCTAGLLTIKSHERQCDPAYASQHSLYDDAHNVVRPTSVVLSHSHCFFISPHYSFPKMYFLFGTEGMVSSTLLLRVASLLLIPAVGVKE